MIERYQKEYGVLERLSHLAMTGFRAPSNNTITEITVWADVSLQSAIFNIRVNGAPLFAGGGRPTITAGGDVFDTITSLSEAILFGDLITLDLEVAPQGGVRNIAFQVTFDDGVGGGSSLGIYSPDTPYATPSTEDDEFATGSLDAKWLTETNAPVISSRIPSHLAFKPGHATQMGGLYQAGAAAADQIWRMKFSPVKIAASGLNFGIYVRDTGTYFITFYYNATNANFYHDLWLNTTGVWTSQNFGALAGIGIKDVSNIYLQLRYIQSTKRCYWGVSFDGINFAELGNEATVGGGSLDRIGIFCNGIAGADEYTEIDWFRKLQGNYTGGLV